MKLIDVLVITSGGGLSGWLCGSLAMMMLPNIIFGIIIAAAAGGTWTYLWLYLRGLQQD